MNCSSFIPALVDQSGGSGGDGGGTTNYNQLFNRPVMNVIGNPVVISKLASGVYNIDGTWVMVDGEAPHETMKDDMFYVLNENSICKMTWIAAGEIYTYSLKSNGDVVEDRVTKESDNSNQNWIESAEDLVGVF